MRLNNKKGSILITLIVAMVMMAALGTGIYTLTTSSTFSELLSNSNDKAYQLARAGIRYGNSLIANAANPATYELLDPGTTFNMPDDKHQFTIAIKNVGVKKRITSTGAVVNPGSFLEARRVLTALLASAGTVGLPPEVGDFNIAKKDLDKYYSPVDMYEVDIKSNPIVGGDRALNLKTDLYTMGLKWYANPSLPWFDQIRDANGGLLNYGVQVKIKPDTPDQMKYFMAGISFRLDDADDTKMQNDYDNMYGISFFKMRWGEDPQVEKTTIKDWWPKIRDRNWSTLIETTGTTGGKYYVVLWKRVGGELGTHTLLAYKLLDKDDLVYDEGAGVLKAWSTIRVDVEEISGGNIIKGYLQAPPPPEPGYPRRTSANPVPIRWDDESTGFFKKISWTILAGSSASIVANGYIQDNSLTTLNYEATTLKAREVGLHQYYYTTSANNIFYDNLAITASWGY